MIQFFNQAALDNRKQSVLEQDNLKKGIGWWIGWCA